MDLFREYEEGINDENQAGKGDDNVQIRTKLLRDGPWTDGLVSDLEDDIKSE